MTNFLQLCARILLRLQNEAVQSNAVVLAAAAEW